MESGLFFLYTLATRTTTSTLSAANYYWFYFIELVYILSIIWLSAFLSLSCFVLSSSCNSWRCLNNSDIDIKSVSITPCCTNWQLFCTAYWLSYFLFSRERKGNVPSIGLSRYVHNICLQEFYIVYQADVFLEEAYYLGFSLSAFIHTGSFFKKLLLFSHQPWLASAMQVSADGLLCCTISNDVAVKIYDVVNYDMMVMIRLSFIPGAVEWVYKQGDAKARVAVSDRNSSYVHIYDARSGSNEPIISKEVN